MACPVYRLPYGRNRKEKPSPDNVKRLAAAGKTRSQIAEELGVSYRRLSYLLNTYYTLNVAFNEGVTLYKEKI